MLTPTMTIAQIISWLSYMFVLLLNRKNKNGIPNKFKFFLNLHDADILCTQGLRFRSVLPFYDVCSL